MKLEFLGVGNFFTRMHHQTNLLIDDRILVDCGMTAGRSLSATGRTFSDIDHIFITHTHADHIGGLEECAFYNRFLAGGRKPHLHLPEELAGRRYYHPVPRGLEQRIAEKLERLRQRDQQENQARKQQQARSHARQPSGQQETTD